LLLEGLGKLDGVQGRQCLADLPDQACRHGVGISERLAGDEGGESKEEGSVGGMQRSRDRRLGKWCAHLRKMEIGDEMLERERKLHMSCCPVPDSQPLVNNLEVIAAAWPYLHPVGVGGVANGDEMEACRFQVPLLP